MRAGNDPLVVGYEHGVRVIVATVQPLLDIIVDRIHADDVRREVEIGEYIHLTSIARQVQISHRDVWASCTGNPFVMGKGNRADLVLIEHQRFCRLVSLVGQRHKEFIGIAQQDFVVSAYCDPSMLEPLLEDLSIIASEGFIEICLLKIGRTAGHVQHHIAAVFGKIGNLIHSNRCTIRRHIDVVSHEGRLVLHPFKKAEGFV